ncbi:MAG: FapA family protein [Spirochaetota bacterium]|nr:FapA family protein [Spirochaetota bacterium]
MKGNLKLEYNKNKTNAHLVFSPDKKGEDWPEKRINALLESEGIKVGIIPDSIKKAEEKIKKTETDLKILIAESERPVPKSKGTYQWEKLEIPAVLKTDGERIFKVAFEPEITRNVVKNVKVKKKVEKKSKLPFGKAKEGFVTVVQKQIVKEPVKINPEVIMTGWADTGSILAVRGKEEEGKPGKTVLGEEIQPEVLEFFTGKGVVAKNNELIAEYFGFIRRGENWIEIIPFKGKSWVVSPSKDKSNAFLKIFAGAQQDMAPSTKSVIDSAISLGIDQNQIIDESIISRIIKETVDSGAFLENFPLTKDKNASYSISTSEDGTKGLLNMTKGSGNGKALKLSEVGAAIKKSGFSGLNFTKIKEDILTFYKSSSLKMIDYVLIEGKAPETGEEVTFSIECEMMKAKELSEHLNQIKKDYEERKPNGIDSLDDYPVDKCKSIGLIEKNGLAVMFSPSKPGLPGKDIYGKVLPGLSGETPNLTILENLIRDKDTLISEIDGFLDIIEDEDKTIIRVRPSKSEIIELEISEDKMEAFLSIDENSGNPITEAEVKEKIVSFGIIKGLKEEILKKAVEASNSGEILKRLLIASGESPVEPGTSRLNMKMGIANDKAVSIRSDGSADFKNQDRITSTAKDDLIAVILSPKTEARDGWDVTGATIKAKEPPPIKTEVGNGIKEVEEENGDIALIAEASGELIQDGDKIYINTVHMVKGDVDLNEGNIKFPGSVKIGGSVSPGFFVMSGGEVQIAGGVEAALVSASESIIIGQGVVGGGKAILRSKQDIEMAFAEQATLLAVGDIKAKNSCLRCKIKCNGKLHLIGDKGNLVGGNTKSTGGLNVANLGNDKEIKTEVSFGQNYLIQDRIELEEKEVEKIKNQIAKIDMAMHKLEKENDTNKLKNARMQKLKLMKLMEKRGLRLFTLRERFEEHFESNITVRGTLYPGVLLESHGRYHEITSEKKNLIITFNLETGKIEESSITKEK